MPASNSNGTSTTAARGGGDAARGPARQSLIRSRTRGHSSPSSHARSSSACERSAGRGQRGRPRRPGSTASPNLSATAAFTSSVLVELVDDPIGRKHRGPEPLERVERGGLAGADAARQPDEGDHASAVRRRRGQASGAASASASGSLGARARAEPAAQQPLARPEPAPPRPRERARPPPRGRAQPPPPQERPRLRPPRRERPRPPHRERPRPPRRERLDLASGAASASSGSGLGLSLGSSLCLGSGLCLDVGGEIDPCGSSEPANTSSESPSSGMSSRSPASAPDGGTIGRTGSTWPSTRLIDSDSRRRSESISRIFTRTGSPGWMISRGFSTWCWASSEMWTRPSTPSRISTNAPNVTTLVTVPSSSSPML